MNVPCDVVDSASLQEHPERVVALGGGTGLPNVLRGFRPYAVDGDILNLTAVVTMSDDGGSSGRLRRTMGLPPPGDVRNCLVALAEEEALLASLFQHRFEVAEELAGHSVGNLILAALAERSGCFLKAVEQSSRVLRIVGQILPATQDDVRLCATLDDGSMLLGETSIASCGRQVRRVSLIPENSRPSPGVLEAIREADLVVLGPGSLYTSLLPNIVLEEIAEALRQTPAVVILVANLVSERGETDGLTLADHISAIHEHVGGACVDAVLLHDGPIGEELLDRYKAEGSSPLTWPEETCCDISVFRRDLTRGGPKLRHDPQKTSRELIEVWKTLRT